MKLYYGLNRIYLAGADNNDIAALEIEYKGNADLVATFSNNCLARHNNNKIIIFNMGEQSLIELFTYVGKIVLLSCRASTRELNQFYIPIKHEETDEWQDKKSTWDNLKNYLGSENKLDRPPKELLGYHELNIIGVDNDSDEL